MLNHVDEVNCFSTHERLAVALAGSYSKDFNDDYYLTIIKDIGILQAKKTGEISLPAHREFRYKDNLISSEQDSLQMIRGDLIIFFIGEIKNKTR